MFLGILIGIILTLGYAGIFSMGVLMGVMGTDSCHGVDGGPLIYLFFAWPTMLLIAAWTPSILYWARVRFPWPLVIGITLGVASIAAYLIYPVWLGYACHSPYKAE